MTVTSLLQDVEQLLSINIELQGPQYIEQLAANLASVTGYKLIMVSRVLNGATMETVAIYVDGNRVGNFSYSTHNCPCEEVVASHNIVCYEEALQQHFPHKNQIIAMTAAQAYIGAPVLLPEGELYGVVEIYHSQSITTVSHELQRIIKIAAQLIAKEAIYIQCLDQQDTTIARQNQLIEQLNRELEFQGKIEGIERIKNRSHFILLAESQWSLSIRNNYPLALCTIELDQWTQLIEKYGRSIADKVLIELIALINERVRVSDIFSRYDTAQFMLLLPNSNAKSAAVLSEKIRELVAAKPITVENRPITVTISIGVAERKSIMKPMQSLIQDVDKALQRAKKAGKNRVALL